MEYIDIITHFILSLLSAYLALKVYRSKKNKDWLTVTIIALIAGLGIDVDHFIDYYFYYGWHFNFSYFMQGYSFLNSGKTYVLFHGYEYIVLLGVLFFIVKRTKIKMFIFAAFLAMFLHLIIDMTLFQIPFQTYSLIYRILHQFKV